MKKIFSLFVFLLIVFISSNNVFAENKKVVYLYKDNIVEWILNEKWEILSNSINWKSFSWEIVLFDENWTILHSVLYSEKVNSITVNSNNFYINKDQQKINKYNIQSFIKFLNNWSFIINYFDTAWNYIFNINWNNIYKDKSYYGILNSNFIETILSNSDNKEIWKKQYFINDDWTFNEVLLSSYAFIDEEKKDLIYDVTCNDNIINFWYNWKKILNTKDLAMISFPTKRTEWVYTFLNINWNQYLLNSWKVATQWCNISISSDPKLESKEVKNTEIIKNVLPFANKNALIKKEEIVSWVYKYSTNTWNNKNYFIYNKNGVYKFFTDKTIYSFVWWNVEFLFWNDGFLITYKSRKSDNYKLILNWDLLYSWVDEKKFDRILKEYESKFKEVSNKDILPVSLDEYKEIYKDKKELVEISPISNTNKTNTNIDNSQNNIVKTTNQTIQTKDKSKYLKQRILSSRKLKQIKKEKYITQIDKIVSSTKKEKLEQVFDRIQKLKKRNDVIDYLEAKIYLELNK